MGIHPTDVHTRGKETRATTQRKLGKDGTTWTPSEQRKRDKALKQFSKYAKGYGVHVASDEFRANYDAIDWGKKE